jgi:hypothetical protein
MQLSDPVNQSPIPPLLDSYTYHSESFTLSDSDEDNGWIMGIDEAGRGREAIDFCSIVEADQCSCPW